MSDPALPPLAWERSLQLRWRAILRVSYATKNDHPTVSKLAKFLANVRHNVGYHYNQPKELLRGYKYYFIDTPPNVFSEYALASMGPVKP